MNKKILTLGFSTLCFLASCSKDESISWPDNQNIIQKTSKTITGNVMLQGASFYHNAGGSNSFVDVLPTCLAGQCAIYATNQLYIRKILIGSPSTTIEGPYNVQVISRPSINYPAGVTIDVLRANVPDYDIVVTMVGAMPVAIPTPRSGQYSICLMPPGIPATLDPNNPNFPQWWNLTYGVDNL